MFVVFFQLTPNETLRVTNKLQKRKKKRFCSHTYEYRL